MYTLENDIERMKEKRERICIELGQGYDWMLVDSLIAINDKINKAEKTVRNV